MIGRSVTWIILLDPVKSQASLKVEEGDERSELEGDVTMEK